LDDFYNIVLVVIIGSIINSAMFRAELQNPLSLGGITNAA
jgi:hypothetical protein